MISSLSQTDFSRKLNPEQLEAVKTLEGPLLLIAGAGSGKTRTLVYRVARLVKEGVDPSQILLLTFTRKAAFHMLQRASRLVGNQCEKVSGGTFHGFANAMLRRYSSFLGLPSTFTILDRQDVQDILHLLSTKLDLAGPGKRFPNKSTLAVIASKSANLEDSLSRVIERYYPHLLSDYPDLERLFKAYRQYKLASALMDYDDLLVHWKDLLEENEEIRKAMGERFTYIMVDEYQDTNTLQARIIRLMATGHANVMVVGDDAQSIYSFRGANFKNILNFPNLFPGTKIIKLEKNYRSTQPNLDCTNAIIAHARDIYAKRLFAHREGGIPPFVHSVMDEHEQARFIADRIEDCLSQGIPPSEIAVLFRMAFHSFHLEGELKKRGIGFVKRGGLMLAESAHIKDLISLLRLMVNPLDRISLNRALMLIPNLGQKGIERIYEVMLKARDPFECLSSLELKARWTPQVREVGRLLKSLQDEQAQPSQSISLLLEWYTPHLERIHYGDYPKRLQEIQFLKSISSQYKGLVDFLSDFVLETPDQEHFDETENKVALSTMHSAKGLEWKVVFVISLAEGRFPAPLATHSHEELEEERRLFYVAATRAKDLLHFCYPSMINTSGSGPLPAKPSRFLSEIPRGLLRSWNYEEKKETNKKRKKDIANPFEIGARVRHPVFGPGRIKAIVDSKKILVTFDLSGEKTLHLDFAKLSLI